MKTANLAIVFTDIQGFTERTGRQTLEENQRLLQVHHALLAPIFKAFGGRIIKSLGDAFLVTFESPTQAVLSGIAIQDRLWHHNRTVAEPGQLHVRVAVNLGEVRVESNDIFGEPVNIAARVQGITEAGEVYFTEAVYLAMNKAEVPAKEVGAFELKGIPGKIRVFHVPRAPYRVEAPSAGAIADAPGAERMPPFGNLALARVPESVLAPPGDMAALGQRAAVGASSLGQRVAVLGRQARVVGGSFLAWLRRPPDDAARARGRKVLLELGLVAVVAGVAVVALGGDAAIRAIEAVEDAPEAERAALVREAKRLIQQETDSAHNRYLWGRLAEAQGQFANAANDYRIAAQMSYSPAIERLIDMLEHPKCAARSEAAEAVANIRLEEALGELEDLAEDGGPDDGGRGGFLGLGKCDSKKAALSALKSFKQD